MEFKSFLEAKFSEIGQLLSYNGATMLSKLKKVSSMANQVHPEPAGQADQGPGHHPHQAWGAVGDPQEYPVQP